MLVQEYSYEESNPQDIEEKGQRQEHPVTLSTL